GEPAALAVLHGDRQPLSGLAVRRERRVRPLHAKTHVPTNEPQRRIRTEDAREQPGLAEDLEAVADAEDRAAGVGERGDRGHDAREARDRAAAQVVAVREAA